MPVESHQWHRPPACQRAFLELVLGSGLRVFGVHLSALHSNWTERRRMRELAALLAAIRAHQQRPHVLAGDFNTLAPGEELDLRRCRRGCARWPGSPAPIRWKTIQMMLDARYVDGYRMLHPTSAGFTFPPGTRTCGSTYVFVPAVAAERLKQCRVLPARKRPRRRRTIFRRDVARDRRVGAALAITLTGGGN